MEKIVVLKPDQMACLRCVIAIAKLMNVRGANIRGRNRLESGYDMRNASIGHPGAAAVAIERG